MASCSLKTRYTVSRSRRREGRGCWCWSWLGWSHSCTDHHMSPRRGRLRETRVRGLFRAQKSAASRKARKKESARIRARRTPTRSCSPAVPKCRRRAWIPPRCEEGAGAQRRMRKCGPFLDTIILYGLLLIIMCISHQHLHHHLHSAHPHSHPHHRVHFHTLSQINLHHHKHFSNIFIIIRIFSHYHRLHHHLCFTSNTFIITRISHHDLRHHLPFTGSYLPSASSSSC